MSTLEHLFRYAKVSGAGDERLVESQENFTTEALAEAIRRNPQPILLALGRAGIIDEDEVHHARVTAVTQWPMPASAAAPSYGFIDLVLHLTIARPDGRGHSETRREIWFENKVNAGLSGNQLAHYRDYIEAHPDSRRDLVLLAPEPMDSEAKPHQLRWQAIADAVRDTHKPGEHWLDLREYLQEIKMTEEWTLPVSAREAISLEDAYHLFRKALAVLRQVNEALDAPEHRELGFPPEFRWPNHWVERTCRNQFAAHGRVTLFFGNGRRVWVTYGYEPIDGETNMTVWLEADPKYADVRGVVRDWAKRHDSLADWGRPVEGWPVLKTTKRAILVDNSEDAVAWFVGAIDQLMGAGLYREIYPEKPAPAPDDEDELEASGAPLSADGPESD
jgi:hypothetical protein